MMPEPPTRIRCEQCDAVMPDVPSDAPSLAPPGWRYEPVRRGWATRDEATCPDCLAPKRKRGFIKPRRKRDR